MLSQLKSKAWQITAMISAVIAFALTLWMSNSWGGEGSQWREYMFRLWLVMGVVGVGMFVANERRMPILLATLAFIGFIFTVSMFVFVTLRTHH